MYDELLRLSQQPQKRKKKLTRVERAMYDEFLRLSVQPQKRKPKAKRRKLTAKQQRSERGKASYRKALRNASRRKRQVFKSNEEEEDAGDFIYTLYDATHPMTGEPSQIALWHARIKQYYGKRVRVTMNGYRTDPKTGKRKRVQIHRVRQLDGYASMFGPSSLYASMAKAVRNQASEDELVTTSLSFELADDTDEDGEHFT